MHKVYFKQAIHLLKVDKVVSSISILGTALAITIVMSLIIVRDIKGANIAPEVNRDKVMYIQYARVKYKNGMMTMGSINYKQCQDFLLPLQTPEYITLINSATINNIIQEGDLYNYNADVTYSDANFWRLFSFSFADGRAFNKEEVESGTMVAVVSEGFARKIFNTTQVINRVITIGIREYRIIGIVKDITPIFKYAYAQIWVPHTTYPNQEYQGFDAVLVAKSKKDFPKIEEEVREMERRINNLDERMETSFIGPYSNQYDQFDVDTFDDEPNLNPAIRSHYMLLIILLLIPAVNLSSISLSKVKERISEIGVRKAFGAKDKTILIQILWENLICTLIGATIGLITSILAVNILTTRLFSPDSISMPAEGYFIPINSLFSPIIFIAVVVVCLLLNILSAGIPAYRASRQKIADALKK